MNNSETPKKVILDLFDLADISHEPGERQTDLEDLIMAETIKERNNMTNLLEEKLLMDILQEIMQRPIILIFNMLLNMIGL